MRERLKENYKPVHQKYKKNGKWHTTNGSEYKNLYDIYIKLKCYAAKNKKYEAVITIIAITLFILNRILHVI
jgi:hypothetical protein